MSTGERCINYQEKKVIPSVTSQVVSKALPTLVPYLTGLGSLVALCPVALCMHSKSNRVAAQDSAASSGIIVC